MVKHSNTKGTIFYKFYQSVNIIEPSPQLIRWFLYVYVHDFPPLSLSSTSQWFLYKRKQANKKKHNIHFTRAQNTKTKKHEEKEKIKTSISPKLPKYKDGGVPYTLVSDPPRPVYLQEGHTPTCKPLWRSLLSRDFPCDVDAP